MTGHNGMYQLKETENETPLSEQVKQEAMQLYISQGEFLE